MADQNVQDEECNLEISMRSEPRLEASQDFDLLEQEIAEAAVDEERRSSNVSSPTPSQQSNISDTSGDVMSDAGDLLKSDKEEVDKLEEEVNEKDEEELESEERKDSSEGVKIRERGRSQSPVDEASWEIVEAVEESNAANDREATTMRSPTQNYCIVRKFLGSQDLWKKLNEIGMVCDTCNDQNMTNSREKRTGDSNAYCLGNLNDVTVSCSESMVICDMPLDGVEAEDQDEAEEVPLQLPLRDSTPEEVEEEEEEHKLPSWKGRIAGAMVVIEFERLGGLLVASVRVNHTDLLSALGSLQQLAASVGLVSYADVDVQRLLARAA